MTAVFLQARMGSSRLPGKALLPLAGKPVLWHAMTALRSVNANVYVVLTEEESIGDLNPVASACGFDLYCGPRDDVLARYAEAIRLYNPDIVVRATGDNPLVSAALANLLLKEMALCAADYYAYDGIPVGTGVEVVRAESLIQANMEADNDYSREHVCPWLYEHPQRFEIRRLPAPLVYQAPEYRVTLDTMQDYQALLTLYETLYKGSPIETDTLVRYYNQGCKHA